VHLCCLGIHALIHHFARWFLFVFHPRPACSVSICFTHQDVYRFRMFVWLVQSVHSMRAND
jgi:hypothetical protein